MAQMLRVDCGFLLTGLVLNSLLFGMRTSKMEPQARFERAASSLPRMRSNQAELLGLGNSVLEELEIKLSDYDFIKRTLFLLNLVSTTGYFTTYNSFSITNLICCKGDVH